MALADYVNTFGQAVRRELGARAHKVALDAGFTCPNRDGTLGRGGCSFCNNASFSPNAVRPSPVAEQIEAGRRVIRRRTGARRYIAYFQAYTNTYADVAHLRGLYDRALDEPDVVGLAVGTRPDCVPTDVLELLADYQARGYLVWLELGLQSSFDTTLARVNRGHGLEDYYKAVTAARRRGLRVCTHLMLGLPGEGHRHALITLGRVLEAGVDGIKLHPVHVVKGTRLAGEYRRGEYRPLELAAYVRLACDLVEATPPDIIYHRLTATAPRAVLRAPSWCARKWAVLNAIEAELRRRGACQGSAVSRAEVPSLCG